MARIKWDVTEAIPEIVNAGMERIKACAEVVASRARTNCKAGDISRPVARKGKYAGQYWTEREPGALAKTIRVVTKNDSQSRNVWIMAGNKKVWYAVQEEFGRGGWKGGGHPFLRPALYQSTAEMKSIIEGGT